MLSLASRIDFAVDPKGYALERALVHLSKATLALLEGRDSEGAREKEQAIEVANQTNVDRDLIPSILESVGSLRLVTKAGARLAQRVPSNLGHYSIVLDGRAHELKVRDRCLSLRHRPLLRRMLYALARRPKSAIAKEALVERLWSAEYNPLVHDNPLWVNTRRLRSLLEGSGLAVELSDEGYRLSVPERFLFIEPLSAR